MNIIVGPNNVGKSNIGRVIKFTQRKITWEHQDYNNFFDNHLSNIYRFGKNESPIKVIIHFKLNKNEMEKIFLYFSMLGQVIAEQIRIDFTYGSIAGQTIQDPVTERYSMIVNQYSKEYSSINGHDVLKKNVANLFNKLWKEIIQDIVASLFPRQIIKLIWYYKEGYQTRPELYVGLNEFILNERDHLGLTYDVKSHYGIDFQKSYTNSTKKIITYLELLKNKKSTKKVESDMKKVLLSTIHNMEQSQRLKLNIDFDKAHDERDFIFPIIRRTFPWYNFQDDRAINLYRILTKWISNSIYISDNVRNHAKKNTLENLLSDEYNSNNLPAILFALKNSTNINLRKRYEMIRNKFLEITNHTFDIASDFTYRQSVEIPEDLKEHFHHLKLTDGTRMNIQRGTLEGIHGDIIIQFFEKIDSEIQFNQDYVGSGFYDLLFILTTIIGFDTDIIFLDEPAVNLHPNWQNEMKKLILEQLNNSNKQIILTTHSPFFIPDLTDRISDYLFYYFKMDNMETKPININIRKIKHSYRKVIDKRKGIFFSNFNIIVEGYSDERIVDEIINNIYLETKKSHKDIVIVNMFGEPSLYIFNCLAKWGMNTRVILDLDAKGKYIKFIKKKGNQKYKKCILLLPSDVEGTIIIGDLLHVIRNIIGDKNYTPIESIEKFGSKKRNQKDITEIITLIKRLNTQNYKSFKEFVSKIITKNISKLNCQIEFRNNSYNLKSAKTISLQRLDLYKKLKLFDVGKEERSIILSKKPIFIERIPQVFNEFLIDIV